MGTFSWLDSLLGTQAPNTAASVSVRDVEIALMGKLSRSLFTVGGLLNGHIWFP